MSQTQLLPDFYSFRFQEEESVIAAYFKTVTGTEYRVYFYPANQYFSQLAPESKLYQLGFHFGFTKLYAYEALKEPIDIKVKNTIFEIIGCFFEDKGQDKILIFYCDDGDGKKAKRFLCFDRWYKYSPFITNYFKHDEEIVIIYPDDNGNQMTDIDYLSIIINRVSPYIKDAMSELQTLTDTVLNNKEI